MGTSINARFSRRWPVAVAFPLICAQIVSVSSIGCGPANQPTATHDGYQTYISVREEHKRKFPSAPQIGKDLSRDDWGLYQAVKDEPVPNGQGYKTTSEGHTDMFARRLCDREADKWSGLSLVLQRKYLEQPNAQGFEMLAASQDDLVRLLKQNRDAEIPDESKIKQYRQETSQLLHKRAVRQRLLVTTPETVAEAVHECVGKLALLRGSLEK
jgi:hypothetical protein